MLLSAIFFSFFYKSIIRKGILLKEIASYMVHKIGQNTVEIWAVFMMKENFIGSKKPYCLCMNYQNFHCCCSKLVLWKDTNILCGRLLTTTLFCRMITTGYSQVFYSSWSGNVSDKFA